MIGKTINFSWRNHPAFAGHVLIAPKYSGSIEGRLNQQMIYKCEKTANAKENCYSNTEPYFIPNQHLVITYDFVKLYGCRFFI
jgi:hypothetical protein